MADFEIVTEVDAEKTLHVVNFAGQAEAGTIGRLMAELAALAARGAPTLVLIDESGLRAGLVLPKDLRGIVERWRATIARKTVRIAVFAPSPLVFGLNKMAVWFGSRDAEGRLAVFSRREEAIGWLLN